MKTLRRIPFAVLLLLTVVVINLMVQPDLLEPGTLNSNMRVFLPLILVAVGQAFVVLTGGIDISVGAIVAMVNALLATQVGLNGDPDKGLAIMALGLGLGMAAGAINGFFVAILRLQPIITTYATSFVFAGLALLILPNPGGGIPAVFTAFYRETQPLGLPLTMYVILLLLLGWYFVQQTRYGRYLFAVGGKADAAYQTGVPVSWVQWSTYVLSGLLASCAGIAMTMLTGSGNAQIGDALTLTSVTAVVIGGLALSGGSGGLGGAITGAIILSLIPNIISFANIDTWWQTFVNALIIVLALATPGVITRVRNMTRGRGMADRREQTADSRQQTADSRQEIRDTRQEAGKRGDGETGDTRQRTADTRQQIGEQQTGRMGDWSEYEIGGTADTWQEVHGEIGDMRQEPQETRPGTFAAAQKLLAPRNTPPPMSRDRSAVFNIPPALAALGLAVILFLLSGLLPNGYGSDLTIARAQATNIIRLAVFLGIVAAGQTLVIISGAEGIDLSAGAVVTLSAIMSYSIVNGQNTAVPVALLVVLLVGMLIGLVNGLGISFLRIAPFVMTLGMAGVVSGLIIVITRGSVRGAVAPLMTQVIARPLIAGIPGAIIIWLFFSALMWLLLQRTIFGKHLFAIGTNRLTARLSGVRVSRMVLTSYALAGMLSGLAGFLIVGNTGVVHIRIGDPFLFPSIAAVAVGGTLLSGGKGSYWGSMAGALVLTLITSLLTTMQMPESIRRMVLGTTLLLMISLYGRQRGLRQ